MEFSKSKLRERYKERRALLSSDEILEKSLMIANQLLRLPLWELEYFHVFLSIEKQKEVDTSPIIALLQGRDKQTVISKTDFETRSMRHFLLTDSTRIGLSRYGVPEPVDGLEVPVSKLDVLLIPLLAYDLRGNRLGYGGGFYDRFLSEVRPQSKKIGLSFFPPEKKIEGIETFDIPLDFVVTPLEVITFPRNS